MPEGAPLASFETAPSVAIAPRLKSQWLLRCDRCNSEFSFGAYVFGCPTCAAQGLCGVLECSFKPDPTPSFLNTANGARGLSRYLQALPVSRLEQWISLGAGGTPLVLSQVVGPRLGLKRLYFKNETVNPTWSFKDRYVAVTANLARDFGYSRVVVSSTGNLGASAAAFAAALRLSCVFIASEEAPRAQLQQAAQYGSHVAVVSRDRRAQVFESLARTGGWFPIGLFLERSVQNPFGIEGYKSFAYEIIEELGSEPQMVAFPSARGNGLYGAWKGFKEAMKWGWTTNLPAMAACQPVRWNSMELSLAECPLPPSLPACGSVATSASEEIPSRQAIEAVRQSGGAAVSADDREILAAVTLLGQEGLCVEPAAALPVACLPKLLDRLNPSDARPIVCVLTGSGMKWPSDLARYDSKIRNFANDQLDEQFLAWADTKKGEAR